MIMWMDFLFPSVRLSIVSFAIDLEIDRISSINLEIDRIFLIDLEIIRDFYS